MANIVQIGPGAYLVIGPEKLSWKMADALTAGPALNGCNTNTLSKTRQYSTASGMRQIGLVIQERLQGVVKPSEDAITL